MHAQSQSQAKHNHITKSQLLCVFTYSYDFLIKFSNFNSTLKINLRFLFVFGRKWQQQKTGRAASYSLFTLLNEKSEYKNSVIKNE